MIWPYTSHEGLIEAGFISRGRITCPICRAEIGIYQISNTMPVFLDVDTFQPHLGFQHESTIAIELLGKFTAEGNKT